MNTRLTIILFLLATAPAALAWPFVVRTGSYPGTQGLGGSSLRRNLAVQTGTDRPLGVFGGGLMMLQTAYTVPNRELIHTEVNLPRPDKDPYTAGNPVVSFDSGRGDAGDLDGDGDTDIVYSAQLQYGTTSTGNEPQNVRILSCRNNGDGTWTRIWQLKDMSAPTEGAPEVKLADLDGDGDLDLIESHTGLRVRWNPGDGNFGGTPTVLRSAVFPYVPDVEVADFDRNGWPDIIIMARVAPDPAHPFDTIGRIELLSNAAGTFSTSVVPASAGREDYAPAVVADLNRDGRPDLVSFQSAAGSGSEMVWRRNTGSGFAAPVVLLATAYPATVAAGDLNEDGLVDIVFSTMFGEAQWLRGLGNGVFAPAVVLIAGAAVDALPNLCLADRDGDGDVDITIEGLFYENTAPHKLAAASVTPWSGINPSGDVSLTVGDVNNDGKQDLIVTDPGVTPARLRWYAGNGSGLSSPLTLSTGNLVPLDVTTGDFNRDGRTDLAWTTQGLLTQSLSTSTNGSTWATTTAASMTGITTVLAADMDMDGDTDILSASPGAATIRIHQNNGSATSWVAQNVSTTEVGVSALAAGQRTPGGRREIASLRDSGLDLHSSTGTLWSSTGFSMSLVSTASRAVVIAEMDATQPGEETFFALNNNKIQYVHPNGAITLTTAAHPVHQLAAADWDADGYNDLLAATAGGVELYTSSRTTTGTAHPLNTSPLPLLSGASIRDLVIMDLNMDGYPDAVAVEASGQLQLIYNRSASQRVSVAGNTPQTLAPGATGTALTITGTHLPVYDFRGQRAAGVAPSRITARFRRSSIAGGVDTPGTTLGNAEVAALVESISLFAYGELLHTEAPATVSGEHILQLSMAARQALTTSRTTPGKSFEIRITLKPTAASSAVSRFYVEYFADSSRWAAIDAAGTSDTLPVRLAEAEPSPPTLFIVHSPTLLDTWRLANFGTYDATGSAANDADPDGDRIPNLLEYVSSQNPNSATGVGAGPVVGLTRDLGTGAMVVDLRLLTTYDSKVKLTLQYSLNPAAGWSQMSTRTGTGAWSLAPLKTTPLSGGSRTRFEFDGGSPSILPKAFYRLKAEELP